VRKKQEKQIRSTEDETLIASWLMRAVSCTSVDELLGK
jgi:hypothetical protein